MNLKWITWALGGMILFLLLFTILLLTSASRSEAQDQVWLRWRKEKPQYQGPIYHYYPERRRRSPSRVLRVVETRCPLAGTLVSAIGQETTNEESALKSAERNWAALVRYDYAEKLMDLKYAENYASRCQRSSTGESATAKVLESVTGGASGVLYRCRIWAEPCLAPKNTDGKDR